MKNSWIKLDFDVIRVMVGYIQYNSSNYYL